MRFQSQQAQLQFLSNKKEQFILQYQYLLPALVNISAEKHTCKLSICDIHKYP